MKLSNEALAAVVDIIRKGLTEMADVSQLLRELDLVPDRNGRLSPVATLAAVQVDRPTSVTG